MQATNINFEDFINFSIFLLKNHQDYLGKAKNADCYTKNVNEQNKI